MLKGLLFLLFLFSPFSHSSIEKFESELQSLRQEIEKVKFKLIQTGVGRADLELKRFVSMPGDTSGKLYLPPQIFLMEILEDLSGFSGKGEARFLVHQRELLEQLLSLGSTQRELEKRRKLFLASAKASGFSNWCAQTLKKLGRHP
ncbi:hypothetical protein GW915_13425 [bacterium]|nr:hypothetical protein [bacterium]